MVFLNSKQNYKIKFGTLRTFEVYTSLFLHDTGIASRILFLFLSLSSFPSQAQLIAQSIGQSFSVAYQEFLRANGIDPEDLSQREYSDLLNTQDMYNDDLIHFSKSENCRDVSGTQNVYSYSFSRSFNPFKSLTVKQVRVKGLTVTAWHLNSHPSAQSPKALLLEVNVVHAEPHCVRTVGSSGS